MIDTRTNDVVQTVSTGGLQPLYLGFGADGRKAYLVQRGSDFGVGV